MDLKNVDIEQYLNKIGFNAKTTKYILEYTNSTIDKDALHKKIKYLLSLGLNSRQIRLIIEENLTFLTEDLELLQLNVNVLKKYLNESEVRNALEVTPEILTLKKYELEQNVKLLNVIFLNRDYLKSIIQDKGDILIYKPEYLRDRFSFFIKNGLKNKIFDIIMYNIEIFDLDISEIEIYFSN